MQNEKEKRRRAENTAEECQDKRRQAEREKEYALTHQKKVEIPVEKPVLYEKCRNCERRAYQQAKEQYEHQRNGLEKNYKAKTMMFDAMLCMLWWYVIVTTIFVAMRSEIVINDTFLFIRTMWSAIYQFGSGVISAGQFVAQLGDKISNEFIAVVVYWLLQIVIPAGAIAGAGIILIALGKKVAKTYRENCWDTVSVMVTILSMAIAVYFGDWIKQVIGLNLVVLVVIIEVVYVCIRTYENGCKRARGYY